MKNATELKNITEIFNVCFLGDKDNNPQTFVINLVTGLSAFAYHQSHPSPITGRGRQSVIFWKIDAANSGASTTRQYGGLLEEFVKHTAEIETKKYVLFSC